MSRHALPIRTAAETALAAQFASAQGALPAQEREASFRRFAAVGLPTRRDESWHYTDLRALMPAPAPLAGAPDAKAIAAARRTLDGHERIGEARLAIVDGRYVAELSDTPSWAKVASLAQFVRVAAENDVDPMLALNGALAQGGCLVRVAERVRAPRLEIVQMLTPGAAKSVYSRVAIEISSGAEVSLVERFVGAGAGDQRNVATILDLSAGAKVAHVSIIEDDATFHVESQTARLAQAAELSAFGFVSGGALARRQIFATLAGEGANLTLSGLSLLDGARHADTTLVVDHAALRGRSREFYKHIIADEATGVYQGKVVVRPGAQKTDGGMKSQAILLSPHAVMNNKPELEIFADDVICGHGATVGALDPEQMFYLRVRGLPQAEAEAMLLEAFGADAIGRVADESLAELLRGKLRAWLAGRAGGAR